MGLWRKYEKNRVAGLSDNGFSVRFEKGTDRIIREKYMVLCRWLRSNYYFPIKLNVYILNSETIVLKNGRTAYGSFRWHEKYAPSIRIPSKPDEDLREQYTEDEIHEQILSSFIHELTHYFQWAAGIEQTDAAAEKQADYYRYRILEMYYESQGETKNAERKY